jgi:hypothetical protein
MQHTKKRCLSPDLLNQFLQLTLHEPPSTTKVGAPECHPEMLKCHQLLVSELPTPSEACLGACAQTDEQSCSGAHEGPGRASTELCCHASDVTIEGVELQRECSLGPVIESLPQWGASGEFTLPSQANQQPTVVDRHYLCPLLMDAQHGPTADLLQHVPGEFSPLLSAPMWQSANGDVCSPAAPTLREDSSVASTASLHESAGLKQISDNHPGCPDPLHHRNPGLHPEQALSQAHACADPLAEADVRLTDSDVNGFIELMQGHIGQSRPSVPCQHTEQELRDSSLAGRGACLQLHSPIDGSPQEAAELRTPSIAAASATLQALLHSGCGRNAQSAIREVLECLREEERALEEQYRADEGRILSRRSESGNSSSQAQDVWSCSKSHVAHTTRLRQDRPCRAKGTLGSGDADRRDGLAWQEASAQAQLAQKNVHDRVSDMRAKPWQGYHGRPADESAGTGITVDETVHVIPSPFGLGAAVLAESDQAYVRNMSITNVPLESDHNATADGCVPETECSQDSMRAHTGQREACEQCTPGMRSCTEWPLPCAARSTFSLLPQDCVDVPPGAHAEGAPGGAPEDKRIYTLKSLPAGAECTAQSGAGVPQKGASGSAAAERRSRAGTSKGIVPGGGTHRSVRDAHALRLGHAELSKRWSDRTVGGQAAASSSSALKPNRCRHSTVRARTTTAAKQPATSSNCTALPAWRPPCGPATRALSADCHRILPASQRAHVQASFSAADSSKVQRKKKKKKKKLAAAQRAAAVSVQLDSINDPLAYLEEAFGPPESAAAAVEKIRQARLAAAMAATAQLRTVLSPCDGSFDRSDSGHCMK